jgi:hypothetical protein
MAFRSDHCRLAIDACMTEFHFDSSTYMKY